jgi:hypothetical protein
MLESELIEALDRYQANIARAHKGIGRRLAKRQRQIA